LQNKWEFSTVGTADFYQITTGTPSERFPFMLQSQYESARVALYAAEENTRQTMQRIAAWSCESSEGQSYALFKPCY
jgi:hypothetical protein